jgi:type I restriction enzyme, S subunit
MLTQSWRGFLPVDAISQKSIQTALVRGRRERWLDEEQRKQALKGRTANRADLAKRYEEPESCYFGDGDVQEWSYAPIKAFGLALGGKRLPSGSTYSETPTGLRYLRVKDFAEGSIDIDQIKYIDGQTQSSIAQYIVEDRDVYISMAGTIGVAGVVRRELSGVNLTENAARIICADTVNPRYLSFYLNSPDGQAQIRGLTVATGQPKLALFRIEEIVVPIPCSLEQSAIVQRIETAFAWIDRLASEATSARKLIEHLDQAILSKAFRGELVPQDPDDEPASVLLERIRMERGGDTARTGRRRRSQHGAA